MKKKPYIVIFVDPSSTEDDVNIMQNLSHSTAIMVYKDYKTMIKTKKMKTAWVKILESDGRVRNHFALTAQPWHFGF
jgi:hypothetical protein